MAADLPVKAPPPAAMPVYLSDWAGFYIGINGGGWGHTKFDFTPVLTRRLRVASSAATSATPGNMGRS
jgi:hypothetical protein